MNIPSGVTIENVQPALNCGRFPIKRVVGEDVEVTADIHAAGRDLLAAAIRYRAGKSNSWQEIPMTPGINDAWTGRFTVDALDSYEYTVQAWRIRDSDRSRSS